MNNKLLICTLAAGVAVSLPGYAKSAKTGAVSDNTFATKAAAGGLTEVAAGKLAEKNGGTKDVKNFGAQMVKDHGAANKKLMKIAKEQNIALPDKPTPMQEGMLAKLGKETGPAFDHDYLSHMLMAHKGDLALFKGEAAEGKNPALKKFAGDTAPVVKSHLEMLESMPGMAAAPHHAKVKMSKGAAGESKSGAAPGSNGAGPEKQPTTSTDTSAPAGPSNAAESKSGVGPASTGNPPGGANGAPVAAPSPK